MPRLLLFAPCERVIIGDDNTASLITLIETLRLNIQEGAILPPEGEDLAAPFNWHALAVWTREESDRDGPSYDLKLQLVMPNGTTPIEVETQLAFGVGKPNHRNVFKMMGFPIARAESVTRVRLLIKPVESNEEWKEAASFPIYISTSTVREAVPA
jgi:hypothetical protein